MLHAGVTHKYASFPPPFRHLIVIVIITIILIVVVITILIVVIIIITTIVNVFVISMAAVANRGMQYIAAGKLKHF